MTTVASEIKSGEQRAKEAAVSIASGCTRYGSFGNLKKHLSTLGNGRKKI